MMPRALCTTLAAVLAVPALGAELPKDIGPEARAEVLKKWQAEYDGRVAAIKEKIEVANTLIKFPATEKEGRAKLAAAKSELKRLEAAGIGAVRSVPTLGAEAAEPGTVVTIPGGNLFQLGEDVKGVGIIAEKIVVGEFNTPVIEDGKPVVMRVLVASPVKLTKTTSKRPPAVDLTGFWYWAGTFEHAGRKIPVLYRFDTKPGKKK